MAELLTDFPERFKQHPDIFLTQPDLQGEQDEARSATVVSFWLPVGRNKGRIVLHFDGIDSISDAEAIVGLDVVVPFAERLPLDSESAYISDLVGCTVYDNGIAIGVVSDVQFPTASDGTTRLENGTPILEVQSPERDEILVPFAKTMIQKIDIAQKRIDMNLPNGLIEINRMPPNR